MDLRVKSKLLMKVSERPIVTAAADSRAVPLPLDNPLSVHLFCAWQTFSAQSSVPSPNASTTSPFDLLALTHPLELIVNFIFS